MKIRDGFILFSIILTNTFICMCVYVCMSHACECTSLCSCVCICGGQSRMLGVFPGALCPRTSRGSLTEPEAYHFSYTGCPVNSRALQVSAPQFWTTGAYSHAWTFSWILGIGTQVLMKKNSYPLRHLPCLGIEFLDVMKSHFRMEQISSDFIVKENIFKSKTLLKYLKWNHWKINNKWPGSSGAHL